MVAATHCTGAARQGAGGGRPPRAPAPPWATAVAAAAVEPGGEAPKDNSKPRQIIQSPKNTIPGHNLLSENQKY